MSSGAAMYAAVEIAKKIERGTIVVIFPDRGEEVFKYKIVQRVKAQRLHTRCLLSGTQNHLRDRTG